MGYRVLMGSIEGSSRDQPASIGEHVTYFHGGPRIFGDVVEPPAVTGRSRSGASGVHVTTDRDLAATYASTVRGQAWVYEVVPLSDPVPVESLVAPGGSPIAFTCSSARIVRRWSVSNAERSRRARAVAAARLSLNR